MYLLVLLVLACDCDDRENLPACEYDGEHYGRYHCDACGVVWGCAGTPSSSGWYYSEWECDCITEQGLRDTAVAECRIKKD